MSDTCIVEHATVTATKGSGNWNMAFAGGLVAVVVDAAITDCSVSDSSVTAGGGSDTFSGAVVGYAQSNNGEVTTISQIASRNNTVVGGGYGGGDDGKTGVSSGNRPFVLLGELFRIFRQYWHALYDELLCC